MTKQSKIYVVSTGMITALGASSEMTAAAVRAGISRYQESPILNKESFPMKLAVVAPDMLPDIELACDDAISKQIRYQRMLKLATAGLLDVMKSNSELTKLPLYLAGPENNHSYITQISNRFIADLAKTSSVNIDIDKSHLFTVGRAGGMAALEMAFKYLDQHNHASVIVGGVDSYLDLDLLGRLELDNRVSAISNMDGFVPGEGAGFLLLSSGSGLSNFNNNYYGVLSHPGLALEAGHRYSDIPYKGEGLAEAVRLCFESYSGETIQSVFSSLNGESLGVKEYGVAVTRNSNFFHDDVILEHPADCFGDIGAAMVPVLIGLACLGFTGGYYKGPGLIYSSSDYVQRAACCIE